MAKDAKTTDEVTLNLIKEVKRRKEEIARCERPNFKTNCNFSYIEGSSVTVNLQVESNVKNLILVAAFVQDKELAYEKAAEQLGVENCPDFTWNGFTAADWLEDVKTRLNKVQIGVKKKKLETLEARLNSIISPELRAKLELEAIQAELED